MPTIKIADATGKMVEVKLELSESLCDKVATFARDNKEDYFEDHSLDWALEEVIGAGCREITRLVKTAKKTAKAKASAKVLEAFNMTPELAAKVFEQIKREAEAKAKAEAEAKAAKPEKSTK